MMKKFFILLCMITFTGMSSLWSQVTTAAINGTVLDGSGEALIGATVIAIHQESGTQYGTTTQSDGRYNLSNMRIGGPYKVMSSYVGYHDQAFDNVFLKLGQKMRISFGLQVESITLDGVTVTAIADNILNSDRTGSSTNIGADVIAKLPSISRSAQDYYRLTPSADGNSFGGRNNKMNNFTLDGSVFNNPFGLDAATPGSQTNAQPISLDAIEQVQVNIAPYDVTQSGFTGASVNAVTKSGTNKFKGTVFGFYRNQDMTGSKVDGDEIFVPSLDHTQVGFSLGGPIIKDKVFFFVNAELERRSDLGTNFLAKRDGLEGEFVSRVTAKDLDLVSKTLKDKFGYETGAYEKYTHRTDNQKAIAKIDWNLSKQHTLTATYNYLDATRDKPAHPGAIRPRGPNQTTLQFENTGYAINNIIHSGIVELKSLFGNKFSNNLQAGVTQFTDSRTPKSIPFPDININQNGSSYIIAGHEPFSIHNRLNQTVFQATNNLNMYVGDHTMTFGASIEKFEFDNSFNLGTYGGTFGPGYASVTDFVTAVNNGDLDATVAGAKAAFKAFGGDDVELGVDQDPNTDGFQGWALAETNVGQLALYAQDEWSVNDNFVFTYGIRMDKALYFDTPTKAQETIDRNCCYDPSREYYDVDGNGIKYDQTEFPKAKALFSPRLGFNWNAMGDNSMFVRGGTGLFTGRFPFVWVGNQVANPNTYFYTVVDNDFQWPQVFRTNIGIDKKLGSSMKLIMDFVYTKDINAMLVRNIAIKKPSGILGGVDGRPIYEDLLDRNPAAGGPFGYDNAWAFTNTDIGRTINFSVQLQKTWGNGFFTSIAYDYLDSKDASSIPAEITSDAFARNPAYGHVNEAVLSPSLYGHNHRVVGSAYKKFSYGEGKWATSVALFYEYVKGGRFSYTYGGDINRDGSPLNDLIYIPTDGDVDNMAFGGDAAAQTAQRTALKAFIAQDEYLSENTGSVAGKYALLSPWYSTWDFRLLQDYNLNVGGRTNTIQLSLDVLNLGNLISSKWGVRQNPTNIQPIGVSVDGDNNPTYSFDSSLKNSFTNDFSLNSRWQMQVGLRYIF